MSANIDALIEQGKRAIAEGNRYEAQNFLIRATELDENNEQAWLWLASAVDSEEEQRICLENILVINPANADAQRMLAELDRKAGSDATHSFDGFDDGASAPTQTDTGTSAFVGNDDPFGSSFDSGGFSAGDSGGPFSSGFDYSPPSAGAPPPPAPMPPAAPPPSVPLPPSAEPSLNDLYDNPVDEEEEAIEAPFGAPFGGDSLPEEAPLSPMEDKFEPPQQSYYEDDFDDGFLDEDDEPDYLEFLPEDVKPTRLPGTDEKPNTGLMIGVGLFAVLNVLALVALIVQVVL